MDRLLQQSAFHPEEMLARDARKLGIAGDYQFRYWRPVSNRKHRIRQFVILHSSGRPQLIAKTRTEELDVKVGQEYRIIRQLAANAAWRGVRVISGGDDGFVMPFVPEHDFPDVFRRTGFDERRALVNAAVDEIWALQRSCPLPPTPRSEQTLNGILGSWRPTEETVAAALTVAPAGAMHGDLGPWNMRVHPETSRLTAIDWEDYCPNGIPAIDVLNMLLTLTLLVHPDYASMPPEVLYAQTFLERSEMSALLAAGLRRYCELSGASFEMCLALVPVYCRAMLRRFEEELRPTAHLFYKPFQDRFCLGEVMWLSL
jgi:hypothetical protein